MPEAATTSTTSPTPGQQARPVQLTPELVKKIASRVYALMQADIKIERERRRLSTQKRHNLIGGQYA